MPLSVLPLLLGAAFTLQPPGAFHGDEPVARHGEHWLALRRDHREAALVAARLTVTPVFDAVLDAPGQTSGRAVASDAGDEQVIAFIRGPGLREGGVEAAEMEEMDPAAGDVPAWHLRFGEQTYRIATRCGAAGAGSDADSAAPDAIQCEVTLHHADGRQQALVRMGGYRDAASILRPGDDATPALLFAGDLDHDGQLDLVFDTTDHYNLSRPTLFLSSAARDGELVGAAAQYQSVGC